MPDFNKISIMLLAFLACISIANAQMKTNFEIGNNNFRPVHTGNMIKLGGPAGYYPQDIQSAYGNYPPPIQSEGTIAIIIAYDDPTALNDFNVFSTQFELPNETSSNVLSKTNRFFQIVYASGTQPSEGGQWVIEASLDFEWLHAMSPYSKIVLVEAQSPAMSDIFQAIQVAEKIPRVNQISISLGTPEFPEELQYDSYFASSPQISFFVADGDSGSSDTYYPASSPYVISVGGTTLNIINGARNETGWSKSGGNVSLYEPMPDYQKNLGFGQFGSNRCTPEISADADANTGVAVYCSTYGHGSYLYGPWFVLGGTSTATVICAGLFNANGQNHGLSWIYSNSYNLDSKLGNYICNQNFNDILIGQDDGLNCGFGWDFLTGFGTPRF